MERQKHCGEENTSCEILETGEFDKEMDLDEKESNIVSKNPENDRSRN